MCAVFYPTATVNMPTNWTDKVFMDDGIAVNTIVVGAVTGSRPPIDDSLTSLNWLHNLNIMGEIHTTTPPTPPASPGPLGSSPDSTYTIHSGSTGNYGLADLRRLGTSSIDNTKNPIGGIGGRSVGLMGPPVAGSSMITSSVACVSSSSTRKNNRTTVPCQLVIDDVDYKSNCDIKPPYSYATLICMAMKANKNKMSLSAIYKWIRDNFMYYRREDTGWQNSIRHNLSLNKCFIKVPRNKDEPGKGGFWRLDPKYAEEMADGTFKKRRMSNRPAVPKIKLERSSNTTCSNSTTMTTTNTTTIATATTSSIKKETSAVVDPNAHTYYLPPTSIQTPLQPTGPTSMSELEATLLPLTPIALHAVPASSRSSINLALDDEAETEAATASLKGDFCWNSVLNEDIELDGLRYKTLDIVDMDVVTNDIAAYNQRSSLGNQQFQSDVGIDCIDSPALSLDADDLFVNSDASNDLSADDLDLTSTINNNSTHINVSNQDWWRLTMAAVEGSLAGSGVSTTMTNVNGSINQTTGSSLILGNAEYDLTEAAAASFLGHVWDDATRPALTGPFDLDGLVDLDGY